MFGQACVDHGIISQNGVCCPGLTIWGYDANTGIAYNGFGCWNATCAQVGQFSPPSGIASGGQCCSGLVAVNGKCAVFVASGGGGSSGGGGITPLPPIETCVGTMVCSIPDMYIYGGLAAVALLMMMGGKKR